ncbi:Uncharacterised protein [Serratia fonticola]|uniref:Uncharacterized protein n=1 Tax=Serratia fonticola TaxID=47917 RepID=A0A4U9TRL7_SERFO|nr:Uncharacterised protein [Serratia fonticola]
MMTGFIIGMIVTVLAAWFIIKNYTSRKPCYCWRG